MKRDDDRHEDADRRLTKTEREIRDRCGNVPKRIRRFIDAYRIARGMVPLWDSSAKSESSRR